MQVDTSKSFFKFATGLALAFLLFSLTSCDLLDSKVKSLCYESDAPLSVVADSTILVGDWDFSYLTYPDRASCRKWTQEVLGYSIAWTFTANNWSYRNLDGRINADGFWDFERTGITGDTLSFSIPAEICSGVPVDRGDESPPQAVCDNEVQFPWFNASRDTMIVDKTHIPLDGRRMVFVRRQ